MSYYDYDPNYDFYYYDEYPDADGSIFYEDCPFDYYLPETRNKRRKHAILARTLDETLSQDDLASRYLVPVMYAPARMADPGESPGGGQFCENIDVYYSDRKNIEKEAKIFRQYAQPCYYASTIHEESEATLSCFESSCIRPEMMEVSRDRPSSVKSKKNAATVTEKRQEIGVKTYKLKKKAKISHSVAAGSKKVPKRIELQKLDAPEASNSWTTLLSGSCALNKDAIIERQKRLDEEPSPELPAQKSKSWMCLSDKSRTSVKLNGNSDASIKSVKERSQSELQAVRDTDQVHDDENVMRNSIYPSTGNVQSMAVTVSSVPSGMVAWKNKSMKPDSSTSDTSKLSCAQELKSNVTIADVSDTTDITINSGEYKEFLDSIKKLKPENVPNQRLINYGKSMQNINPNSNNNSVASKHHKIVISGTESTETFLENVIRMKQAAEEREYLRRRTNPLVEVPLSLSNKVMYVPTFTNSEFLTTAGEEFDGRVVSKKKSIFVKVFRTVADAIACCQTYAYKYVLRFILFI